MGEPAPLRLRPVQRATFHDQGTKQRPTAVQLRPHNFRVEKPTLQFATPNRKAYKVGPCHDARERFLTKSKGTAEKGNKQRFTFVWRTMARNGFYERNRTRKASKSRRANLIRLLR